MVTKKVSKSIDFVSSYSCENCGYITSVKSNYNKHCSTAKHLNVTNVTKVTNVTESNTNFCCKKCSKVYKSRYGLWRHIKDCNGEKSIENVVIENVFSIPLRGSENPSNEDRPIIDANVFLDLIKQNKELQNLLVHQTKEHNEQSKKQLELINKLVEREPANNTINGNVTNNNNKFNLNFFLNETCKDAMSIQEFMENIRITFQDLLKIGDEGFVNGVSDIFIKQLQNLDVSKRPIHCTDSKRETIYFKEDVWNKDDKDKTRLKQIIEKIEYRNVAALRDWCNENPDSRVNNTPNNLLKDKIYLQTLQGDERTRDKIIKNISKEVMVEKE